MLNKENSYIVGLEGKDVYDKVFAIKEKRKRVKTLDYSLETIKLNEIGQSVIGGKKDNLFYRNHMDKQCTDVIMSLSFDLSYYEYNKIKVDDSTYYLHYKSTIDIKNILEKTFKDGVYSEEDNIVCIKIGSKSNLLSEDLPKGFVVKDGIIKSVSKLKTIANSNKIREKLYRDGFDVIFEGKNSVSKKMHFVRYKRSAGSARTGTCLFIWDKLYKKMMKWSKLGIKFRKNQNIDLAGFEAYISLTLSSIIDTMEIDRKNILVIDDYNSTFKTIGVQVSETIVNGEPKLTTKENEFEKTNSIWDGQSLMDKSIFPEKYKDKGMLLLRQQFFKSACFNSNIQQYFKDNNITSIDQLKGFTLAENIEDIKLITTPSSIKFVKFGKIEDYFNRVDNTFGIVKYEKPQRHLGGRGYVQTHYQLINTLQLNYEETKLFLGDTIDYIENLKTDFDFMKLHLKIRDQECKFTGQENDDEFIFKMIQLNEDFRFTKMYKKFKEKLIASFIRNVLRGHVFVKGNYSTLVGNPIEMLSASCGLFNGESILGVDEICCTEFNLNEELIGSRSPHPCSGNILIVNNCSREKLEDISRYINVTKEIACINSIGNNILERLAGSDFDGDTLLLSNNRILIDSAKKNYDKFLVPTGEVSSMKANRRECYEDKLILDITANTNWIGIIINMSQIINSYIWEHLKKGEIKEAEELYVITSQLSVLSNLAIDATKKNFNIDIQEELDFIKKNYIDCRLKPYFFITIAKDKGNEIKKENFVKMNTSMDYLTIIMERVSRRKKSRAGDNFKDEGISISALMCRQTGDITKASIGVLNSLTDKIISVKRYASLIWGDTTLDGSEKYILYKNSIESLEDFIGKKKLSKDTIKALMYRFDKSSNEDIVKSYSMMYKTVYKLYPQEMTQLLKKDNSNNLNKKKFKIYEDEICTKRG